MDTNSRFHQLFQNCPQCGKKLLHDENNVSCEACSETWYNNPAPATSIALIKDGKILLAKRKVEPEKGKWDILGGFVEAGESIEDAVIREMKEETNLDVEITEYLGSVADIYGGKPSLPILYKVKMADENQTPNPQDDVEELAWFSTSEIPKNPAFKNVEVIIEKIKKDLV
jgi:NADH pyrophosphatase NudC (nudix superfamily)